jgi:DNA-binding SARP family transcriptional activator/tetratricopeptide (TPR) repeat protein
VSTSGSTKQAPVLTAQLSLHVLGQLTARRGDDEIAIGGRRQRAVLGLLVVARGDIVSSERLTDSLWPEEAPRNAGAVLQSYISHLRRALEPARTARDRASVLASEGGGYACRLPDDAVDAWRFERLLRAAELEPAGSTGHLETALALWRGPAYAEYAGEVWADTEAGRLSELRTVARERLLAARLAAGEAALLVPELEAMTAEDPLREERWRLLALALYRAHRQADALGALRRARGVLADDLGVDPGPALRALEAEILAQSPALDVPPPPVPAQRADGVAPPAAPPSAPTDLMDRDREVVEVRACLADAVAGQGRVVLLEGPAGIGKTRLLMATRRIAAGDGARLLAARGSQLEKEFGFGVVRQLFEPLLGDDALRERLLTGSAASAAGVFGGGALERADGSFAVLHGLYWLTVNLAAEQPLVLAVDDLQWCDSASLRFLAYLARRLDGLRVLVATTLRTGEEYDDPELLAELTQDPATVVVRPRPLTPAGVGDLVRQRLGDEAAGTFIDACHRVTRGNPLLVRQLLRALEADSVRPDALHAETVTAIGSRAISGLVLMRLQRMKATARAVATAVSVLGDGASLPAVAALADLPETETAAAISALSKAEMLRDEHPIGFVHPLVQDAVYRDLSPGERELHHERAAHALDDAGAAPEQVAAHLMQVPMRSDGWSVSVLRKAAATAADRGAAESAVAYLRRALEERTHDADRAQVLLELGQLEASRDGRAAVDHLHAAYQLIAEPRERAAAALLLAQVLVFAGEEGEATEFARAAATVLPADLVDERQGLLALERISAYMHGLPAAAWRGGHREIEGRGFGARMLATQQAWDLVVSGRDRDKSIELARFALMDGELQKVDPGLFWVVAAAVLGLADEDLGSFWEDVLSTAHARGSLFAALAAHLWRGHEAALRGDLREAQHALELSNEQSRRWGAPRIGVPYGKAFVVRVLLERGDLDGARAALEEGDDGPRIGDGERLVTEAEVRVLTAEGRFREALQLLDRASEYAREIINPAWRPEGSLRAAALAGLGRTSEAVALLEEELVAARAWGAPRLIGRTLRLLGELQGANAEAALREAVEVLSPTTARLELASALHSLAGCVAETEESQALLLQALDLARECGADGLRSSCLAVLTARGVSVPAQARGAAPTRTEQRIAAMHDRGADLRTIAQTLFLTPGFVQSALDRLHGPTPG